MLIEKDTRDHVNALSAAAHQCQAKQHDQQTAGQTLGYLQHGASLSGTWKFCPYDGKKLQADWRHCPECGVAISIGSLYQGLSGNPLYQSGTLGGGLTANPLDSVRAASR